MYSRIVYLAQVAEIFGNHEYPPSCDETCPNVYQACVRVYFSERDLS